jgi:hypothetical protein
VIEDAPPGIAVAGAGRHVIGVATMYPAERLDAADTVFAALERIGVEVNGDRVRLTILD